MLFRSDMCPTLQEEPIEQVNVAGGFPGQPQRKYDPYSNTYNPGWRDHPNFCYGNPQVNPPATQNHPSFQKYKQPYIPRQQSGQTSNSGMSLEDIVKSLAINTLQFQQETKQFQQEARASFKIWTIRWVRWQPPLVVWRLKVQGNYPLKRL